MTLSSNSISAIRAAILEAVRSFAEKAQEPVFSDIHIQVSQESGELTVYDDDDNRISQTEVQEWQSYSGDDFIQTCAKELQKVLASMQKDNLLDEANLVKPYSYVLVDEEKETFTDLLIMDDETLIVSGGFLEGLDEDLNAFLKDLLKED